MNPKDCVPKHKLDNAAVHRVRRLGFPGLNPVLPELLEWVQDGNWPVAQDLMPLLAKAGPEIVPHIRTVLASEDDEWKYWVLFQVVSGLDPSVRAMLATEIERIARDPTDSERDNLAAEAAEALLSDLPGNDT